MPKKIHVGTMNVSRESLGKIDNTDNLSEGHIEDLLLQKEKLWIGTLVTQHQDMNATHDWNHTQCKGQNQ